MKKSIIIFLSLFFISLVTASPSLDFQHEEIYPGETILATITTTGEFTKQIQPSDITFYQNRKQVFFESDITFYKGIHYLYIYTTREGNFSIQIADILYKEVNEIKSATITKLFNITEKVIVNKITNETSTQILSIKPGFIFTSGTQSLKLSNKGNVTLNLTYDETELSLETSETREINLNQTEPFSYLNISSYKEFSIPIIYLTTVTEPESPSTKPGLVSHPQLLLVELFTNNETQKTIQISNLVNENITDIQTTSNLSFVTVGQLQDMGTQETQDLIVTFNTKNPGHLQGYINITYAQNSETNILSVPLNLFILPEGSEPDFQISEETCEEISGIVCTTKEICDGEATFTKNGEYCCLGICQSTAKDESENNFGWIIALIIFGVLGAGGYYLYKKQKKVTPKKPEEQMKESSEKLDKRIKGIPKTKRITGRIARS